MHAWMHIYIILFVLPLNAFIGNFLFVVVVVETILMVVWLLIIRNERMCRNYGAFALEIMSKFTDYAYIQCLCRAVSNELSYW